MKAYIISGIYSPSSEWRVIDVCSSAVEADKVLDDYRAEGSAYERIRCEIWEYHPSNEGVDPQTIETFHKVVLGIKNSLNSLDDARHDLFKARESLSVAERFGDSEEAFYNIRETIEGIQKLVEGQNELLAEMLDRYKDDNGIEEEEE